LCSHPAACSAKTVGRVPAAVRTGPAEAAAPVETARRQLQEEAIGAGGFGGNGGAGGRAKGGDGGNAGDGSATYGGGFGALAAMGGLVAPVADGGQRAETVATERERHGIGAVTAELGGAVVTVAPVLLAPLEGPVEAGGHGGHGGVLVGNGGVA